MDAAAVRWVHEICNIADQVTAEEIAEFHSQGAVAQPDNLPSVGPRNPGEHKCDDTRAQACSVCDDTTRTEACDTDSDDEWAAEVEDAIRRIRDARPRTVSFAPPHALVSVREVPYKTAEEARVLFWSAADKAAAKQQVSRDVFAAAALAVCA